MSVSLAVVTFPPLTCPRIATISFALEGKLRGAIEIIRARPSDSVGWQNQLEHAVQRLNGVQTLLATPVGQPAFPNGADPSQLIHPGYLMTKKGHNNESTDDAMVKVLEQLLAEDTDITARAVARLHPSLAAASSITRNPTRMALLSKYREQQATYRRWKGRVSHLSGADQSTALAAKNARIAELEAKVQLLTACMLQCCAQSMNSADSASGLNSTGIIAL